MKQDIITEAQKYLTINDGFRERKLVDLVSLSQNHDSDELVLFLCDLYYEKHKFLSRLIERDDNSILMDMSLGAMFRITMAIRLIRDEREEDIYESQQRTAAGG